MAITLDLQEASTAKAGGDAATGTIALLAFVSDPDSENVLRTTLKSTQAAAIEVQQATISRAIAILQRRSSPRVLLVDVSGDANPLDRLQELSEVVEPNVRVLVIGDRQDMNFYRQVTRSLGAAEYLYKPLSPDMVERFFGPVLSDEQVQHVAGGKMLTVTGVRGGVGATTLAVNIAWFLAEQARRHTVLLDANLQTGNATLLLGLKAGGGLRSALAAPERLDETLLDRAVAPAGPRLNILAGEIDLTDLPTIAPEGASQLVGMLRQHYNFVIADIPQAPVPVYYELASLADQRLLVMDGSLASVRETLRQLARPSGSRQKGRPTIVLNGADRPGGLSRRQVEDALETAVDVALPYLAQAAGEAATLGKPLIASSSKYQAGIQDLVQKVLSVGNSAPGGQPKTHSLLSRLRRAT